MALNDLCECDECRLESGELHPVHDYGETAEPAKATPLPVQVYTAQPPEHVRLVAHNKLVEERLLRVCDELRGMTATDKRWVAEAVMHFETGFMALNRAVFKPTRISLPEDTK